MVHVYSSLTITFVICFTLNVLIKSVLAMCDVNINWVDQCYAFACACCLHDFRTTCWVYLTIHVLSSLMKRSMTKSPHLSHRRMNLCLLKNQSWHRYITSLLFITCIFYSHTLLLAVSVKLFILQISCLYRCLLIALFYIHHHCILLIWLELCANIYFIIPYCVSLFLINPRGIYLVYLITPRQWFLMNGSMTKSGPSNLSKEKSCTWSGQLWLR